MSNMDERRAYIVLGLAEENYTISKKWFETTIHHLLDELFFMNISPCIVSCRKRREFQTPMEKIYEGKKEIYTTKQNWNYTSCYSLNVISKQRKVDIIKCLPNIVAAIEYIYEESVSSFCCPTARIKFNILRSE